MSFEDFESDSFKVFRRKAIASARFTAQAILSIFTYTRTFFRSGQIEAWGRGVEKIKNTCRDWGKAEPFYRVRPNEVMIGFNTESKFTEKFTENETQQLLLG